MSAKTPKNKPSSGKDADKRNVREPFPPDHTPAPPQIIDPTSDEERNKKGTRMPAEKEK